MSKSKYKLYPSLHYNEDKTAVTLTIMSSMPINENEFKAALFDWLRTNKDGYRFEDIGDLVEFEMVIDDEYDGSPKH